MKTPTEAIEVVTSFDTTGSMYPCLTQVRREVVELGDTLFKEIPNLRMGAIAHGDYCDEHSTYVTKHLELTDNKSKFVNFVKEVKATGGGDAPECYELVLHEARSFNWTYAKSKVLVMIGDDVPHGPHDNPKRLDWRNELSNLLEMGVKVYAVQALERSHATKFWQEMAKATGGFHLELSQFSHVADFIRAICYQQVGPDQLDQFEEKLKRAGRVDRSVNSMFDRLRGRPSRASSSFSKEYGERSLDAVPSSRFQVLHVPKDCTIRDFVEDNGLTFRQGRGFYEFTKRVLVQAGKEVILQDKFTGDMFSGKAARKLAGIRLGEDVNVGPSDVPAKYRAFIQSTSVNRRLLEGTEFLYEVDFDR